MVNSVGNTANSYSGMAIYCNNVDLSKLSPEERKQFLEKMPNTTFAGNYPCYPAAYFTNNFANPYLNGNIGKKVVTVLTDDVIKKLDADLESPYPAIRVDAANNVIQLIGEDETRHNDKGLNALLNKMLINPYDKKVRRHALAALSSKLADGDENTRAILYELDRNPQGNNVNEADQITVKLAIANMERNNNTVVYAPSKAA